MKIFPDFLGLPPDFEDRILEATRKHWHELSDYARDALAAVIAGSMPASELVYEFDEIWSVHLVVTAWYYAAPYTRELDVCKPDYNRDVWNSKALAALDKLEPITQ